LGSVVFPAPHYRETIAPVSLDADLGGIITRETYNLPKRADLYYCARADGGSVIARFSSRGSDYASSPVNLLMESLTDTVGYARERKDGNLNLVSHTRGMSTSEPALLTALVFAKAKGLIR